jgi:hypothetical protein
MNILNILNIEYTILEGSESNSNLRNGLVRPRAFFHILGNFSSHTILRPFAINPIFMFFSFLRSVFFSRFFSDIPDIDLSDLLSEDFTLFTDDATGLDFLGRTVFTDAGQTAVSRPSGPSPLRSGRENDAGKSEQTDATEDNDDKDDKDGGHNTRLDSEDRSDVRVQVSSLVADDPSVGDRRKTSLDTKDPSVSDRVVSTVATVVESPASPAKDSSVQSTETNLELRLECLRLTGDTDV